MRKTALGAVLFTGAVLAAAVIVEAQQPAKLPKVGFLATGTSSVRGGGQHELLWRAVNLATLTARI